MTVEEFLERIDEIMCGTSNAERAYLEDLYNKVTKPHWISVEDELPPKRPNREQSKNVLVRTNSGRTKIEYYDYGNDVIKEWWEYNITLWMPLPEAPKEGGRE
jgi:hypothetical protein